MIVEVLYQGLTLAKAAPARAEGEALFVELEAPMPVGTQLLIRDETGERPARVERVQEGAGPGMLLRFGAHAAATATAVPTVIPPTREPTAKPEPEPDPDPDSKRGGRQRKKTRKTVIGH